MRLTVMVGELVRVMWLLLINVVQVVLLIGLRHWTLELLYGPNSPEKSGMITKK